MAEGVSGVGGGAWCKGDDMVGAGGGGGGDGAAVGDPYAIIGGLTDTLCRGDD